MGRKEISKIVFRPNFFEIGLFGLPFAQYIFFITRLEYVNVWYINKMCVSIYVYIYYKCIFGTYEAWWKATDYSHQTIYSIIKNQREQHLTHLPLIVLNDVKFGQHWYNLYLLLYSNQGSTWTKTIDLARNGNSGCANQILGCAKCHFSWKSPWNWKNLGDFRVCN